MTVHLLGLTVGPVQEFIAAARRTRDLWFGSFLLSEISKAAAKAVQDHGGALIFPAPQATAELRPDSRLNVANVIVAELRDSDPATVARAAYAAAGARWRSFADQVFSDHHAVIDHDIWHDQVDDVIEFSAAWVQGSPSTYQADRANLMRLLAGRKRCRDFSPAKGRARIPKSSLDGLRESVLVGPGPDEDRRTYRDRWPIETRRRLRVSSGEELDVVGVVKRTAEGHRPYPSVARVAADPWLRGVGTKRLGPLIDACQSLGSEVLHALDISLEQGHPHYASFPFEGTVVYRSRYPDLQQETQITDLDLAGLSAALAALTRDFSEPNPYLAVLVADGDRMGRSISAVQTAQEHRELSQALARFAGKARELTHKHRGVLVYAGGDDLLAFVPVDQCLPCARALSDCFAHMMAPATDSAATMSVGVAIAHFMEPLEDLLEYGRAAEKHAKRRHAEDNDQEDRNGLAVHVIKRGGGPVAIRANWFAGPDEHLHRLAAWINARAISGRVAYDLHKIASVYDLWPTDTVHDALQRDTIAMLKNKEPVGESRMHEVEDYIRQRVAAADSLRRLADELLVARQIAVSVMQAADGVNVREGAV